MKTIIAGSRSIKCQDFVNVAIEMSGFQITEVVSGTAKGVDRLGEEWAYQNRIPIKPFKPDWNDISHPDAKVRRNRYGSYDANAGKRRNKEMAHYADALIAVWDGESGGTKHMFEYAMEQGLNVKIFIITEHGEITEL